MRELRRLKITFVVAVMVVVTLFLVTIFSVLYLSSRKELNENMEISLRAALDDEQRDEWQDRNHPGGRFGDLAEKPFPDQFTRTPVLVAKVSDDDDIETVRNDMFFMETSFIEEVVAATPYKDKSLDNENLSKSYRLEKYSLRYMIHEEDDDIYIAYVDESDVINTLVGMIKRSVIIGLAVFFVMLILSILLSNVVVRPVERAWEDQKRFVADASHELKTPLAVILSNTDMITKSEDKNSEKNLRRLENVKEESERMKELVSELLDVARGDIDKKELLKENINLSELVEDELLVWEPLCYEKSRKLESNISEEISINGDSSRIKKLISILIDNAIKYSLQGSIIKVELKENTHSGLKRSVKLIVEDEGEPLSGEECERIFERFVRVDDSRESTPGYGLGLSIAKQIAAEHGGRIYAESDGVSINRFVVEM